jgi:transcriptional regulator with XRE-family HTH domain
MSNGGDDVPRMTAHDTLRAALVLDRRPLRQIAREAKVSHPSVVRFANGQRSLSPRSFDRVAGVLGYELRPRYDAAS